MQNSNIFAVQFNPARPFGLGQYANAMFQHAASISSNASSDDLRHLQAIATNVKTAHEFHLNSALQDALRQLEEQKAENAKLRSQAPTAPSTSTNTKEHNEQLKAMYAEIQQKDHEIAQWNELFNIRLNEKTRRLSDQLKAKSNENDDLRRLFAKAVENKVRDEVARQMEDKEMTIARLNDKIKDYPKFQEKHYALVNSIYKKNEEIKDLREQVSELREWRDAYKNKALDKENSDPKTFDQEELIAEIDKLDVLNTSLKSDNEEYREEIRGYETLHGMMDANWVAITKTNNELCGELNEASRRLQDTQEELQKCRADYERLSKTSESKINFLNVEFEKLKSRYNHSTRNF